MTIWFDMDGTFVDLYGQENWLADIIREDTKPYENAKPLLNMQVFARTLNRIKQNGTKIGVVSWTAKNGTAEYCERIAQAKKQWLKVHLKSVQFDFVDIIPYGEPKQNGRNGVLFDDEKPNRENWNGTAYNVHNIINILRTLQ